MASFTQSGDVKKADAKSFKTIIEAAWQVARTLRSCTASNRQQLFTSGPGLLRDQEPVLGTQTHPAQPDAASLAVRMHSYARGQQRAGAG